MRKKGFYWVKLYDKWVISEYDKSVWWFHADDCCRDTDELQEIGERIETPDKGK